MVRHHLQGYQTDLGIADCYFIPARFNPLPQLGEHYPGGIGGAVGGIAATRQGTQEGASALSGHGYHVHLPASIVMAYAAALHGGLLRSGKHFLTLINLAFHACKGTKITRNEQTTRLSVKCRFLLKHDYLLPVSLPYLQFFITLHLL